MAVERDAAADRFAGRQDAVEDGETSGLAGEGLGLAGRQEIDRTGVPGSSAPVAEVTPGLKVTPVGVSCDPVKPPLKLNALAVVIGTTSAVAIARTEVRGRAAKPRRRAAGRKSTLMDMATPGETLLR